MYSFIGNLVMGIVVDAPTRSKLSIFPIQFEHISDHQPYYYLSFHTVCISIVFLLCHNNIIEPSNPPVVGTRFQSIHFIESVSAGIIEKHNNNRIEQNRIAASRAATKKLVFFHSCLGIHRHCRYWDWDCECRRGYYLLWTQEIFRRAQVPISKYVPKSTIKKIHQMAAMRNAAQNSFTRIESNIRKWVFRVGKRDEYVELALCQRQCARSHRTLIKNQNKLWWALWSAHAEHNEREKW